MEINLSLCCGKRVLKINTFIIFLWSGGQELIFPRLSKWFLFERVGIETSVTCDTVKTSVYGRCVTSLLHIPEDVHEHTEKMNHPRRKRSLSLKDVSGKRVVDTYKNWKIIVEVIVKVNSEHVVHNHHHVTVRVQKLKNNCQNNCKRKFLRGHVLHNRLYCYLWPCSWQNPRIYLVN